MKAFSAALVLAAFAAEALAAVHNQHAQFHNRAENAEFYNRAAYVAAPAAPAPKPVTQNTGNSFNSNKRASLSTAGTQMIQKLGIMKGKNACPVGSAGAANIMEFTNNADEDMVVVLWDSTVGYQASFVKATQPVLTHSIPAHGSCSFSLAGITSGAFAPVYGDTVMSQWGQISNTWGEFTFGPYGVVDVSREVYANGRQMTIKGVDSQCTSTMDKCVFKCKDGNAKTCGVAGSYQLCNCSGPNSVPGGWNGGCAIGATQHVKVTFS